MNLLDSDANLDSNNTTLPTSILAFRSITTMLSCLQGTGRMRLTHTDNSSLPREVRQELRILVALATILVRKHEVVSVVALQDKLEHPRLKSIACTIYESADDKERPEPEDEEVTPKANFWSLFTTGNYRRDNNKMNGSLGVKTAISPVEKLNVSSNVPSELYVNYGAHSRTFDDHVTIISNIITNLKHDPRGMDLFQDYVIAACLPKIFGRLKHPNLSRPFINALNGISSFEFKDAYPEENYSDERLRTHILGLAKIFPDKIPGLYERCKLPPTAPLYTADTCTEFHWLLCELLRLFETRLAELDCLDDPEKFPSRLKGVTVYGNALWALSRSGAIESHMKAIEAKLSLLQETVDKRQDGGAEGDEIDADLQGVQPSAYRGDDKVPLWMSCRDWLRLMVVHFDAVAIVQRYVAGEHFPYVGVSLTVIPPPPVDNKLLPWEELLRSEHFPRGESEEIIKFLKDLKTKAKVINKAVKTLQASRLPFSWHQLWDLLAPLQNKKGAKDVEDSEDPNITKAISMAKSLKPEMDRLSKASSKDKSVDSVLQSKVKSDVSKILEMLKESMPPGIQFLNVLEKMETGASFAGAEHCEAHLGVHIMFGSFKNAGHVLGASKPCCPVCHHLLQKLSGYRVSEQLEPFVTRGAHNSISPCSLPTRLSEEMIRDMNMTFGNQLKDQLIKFMVNSRLVRKRTTSSTSHRLSLDTLGGHEQEERSDINQLYEIEEHKRKLE